MGSGEGEPLSYLLMERACSLGWKVLRMDSGDGCTTVQMCLMPLTVPLKMVKMMHFTLCTFHHNQPFYKCTYGHLFTSHYAPGLAHAFPTLHLWTVLSGSGHCDAQVKGAGRWPHFLEVIPLVPGWAGFAPRQGDPRSFINIAHLVESPFKRTDTFHLIKCSIWTSEA